MTKTHRSSENGDQSGDLENRDLKNARENSKSDFKLSVCTSAFILAHNARKSSQTTSINKELLFRFGSCVHVLA